MKNKILCGDSLEVLKDFEDNYFDSVVTDPPYGLAFMGKKWDYDVPQVELWKEVYRVLKPGGYILSFAGSGTTLIACKQQGFNYIGIEREQEYCDIAEERLKAVKVQGELF